MEKYKEYYLELLKASINGTTPPEPDKNIDWRDVYLFSTEQSQFSCFYDAVLKLKNRPEQSVLDKMKINYDNQIRRDATREFLMNEILEKFEEKSIKCMGLKGYIVRNFYPKSVYRYLSDFDILCEPSQLQQAQQALLELGYNLYKDDPHHLIFVSRDLPIELHKSLFINEFDDYFGVGFERAHPVEGKKFNMELSTEDFYIYFIAHAVTHFVHAGIGLRTLTDIYLFWKKYEGKIDSEYIESQLQILGISKFNNEFKKLAVCVFDDGDYDEISRALLESVMSSNTSGNVKREAQIKAASGEGNKRFLKAVFPSYDYLVYRYEWLKGKKYLIALAWLKRALDIVLNKSRRDKIAVNLAVHSADDVTDLFSELELEKFLK